jgi:hypothetical protein
MQFDPENPIVKLCAHGMQLEGEGKPGEASATFNQAWGQAINDFEKFTAAHYVARNQDSAAISSNRMKPPYNWRLVWMMKALKAHCLLCI